ncbi:5833_t:CDS:2, partial [Entrophospora sp. SA101]
VMDIDEEEYEDVNDINDDNGKKHPAKELEYESGSLYLKLLEYESGSFKFIIVISISIIDV